MSTGKRQKIAILGGGVGAITAAYGITLDPDWKDKYEITVYQKGWRLGGKGASGRNAAQGERIEEHGLHVWAGFYDNGFMMIKDVYERLGRAPGSPMATWQDAFKKHSFVTFQDFYAGSWHPWNIDAPTNDEEPGTPGTFADDLSPWSFVERGLQFIINQYSHSEYGKSTQTRPSATPDHSNVPAWLKRVFGTVEIELLSAFSSTIGKRNGAVASGAKSADGSHPDLHWLRAAVNLVRHAGDDILAHSAGLHHAIAWLIDQFEDFATSVLKDLTDQRGIRQLLITVNFACTHLRGILLSGVIFNGFFSIDDEEWVPWMRKYGIWDQTVASPLVRGVYDYIFGYEDGDTDKPSVAAGTCVNGLLRLGLTYKGALFWEMQAGMGDIVFAPPYELLEREGVKFEFFHKVKNLAVDGDTISRIDMARQVDLKDPSAGYNPLVNVKGLSCWPSEPRYEQLVDGDTLKAAGVNLECPWADWSDVEDYSLHAGTDFDLVVLGISIGGFPYVCSELIDGCDRWKDMMNHVQSVQTQAFQLWLDQDVKTLGWPFQKTMMTAYAQPQNTWADMSQLIPQEDWPTEQQPKNIAYFCGPMKNADPLPPFSDHEFPKRQTDQVRVEALQWAKDYLGHMLPNLVDHGVIDWDRLIDVNPDTGEARFNAQYFRANFEPSERYVISLPGSTFKRMKADQSGFENLYLAGDWVFTAINAGCVEAAVMAGMQASRAICGYPQHVIGDLS